MKSDHIPEIYAIDLFPTFMSYATDMRAPTHSGCPSRERRIRIRFRRGVTICPKMHTLVEVGALNTNKASVLTEDKWFDLQRSNRSFSFF